MTSESSSQPFSVTQNMSLFCMPKRPGNIDQRLEGADHAGLDDLVAVTSHVRLFVQMKSNAVRDEADRLEAELAEFFQEFSVNLRAARAGLDQVHDQIFALDQIRPDLVLLRRGVADHRRAANAGEVAAFLAEDLHPMMSPFCSLRSVGPTLGNWLRSPEAMIMSL